MLSRTETVRVLLRTFNEARDSSTGPEGMRGTGERVPGMSRMWRQGSYAHLERCLLRMRDTTDAHRSVPVTTLYWHLAERYLRSVDRTTNVRMRVSRPHGRMERVVVRRVVRVYSDAYSKLPEARRRECRDLGVSWVVDDLDRHGVSPFLPPELMEAFAA